MPSTFAFISQTGNVMKSTIAAAVGVTLVDAGFSVLAVDLDPEHRDRGASLATWLEERRERHPMRTQVPVERPQTAREALSIIAQTHAEIVLIDCPSRATDPFSDVGSRLIVIDRWIIDTGDAQVLVGRMSGMSNVGGSYIKDVLLYKFDGSDHDGQRQSGNFSLSSMSAYQRARFKDLARMRPRDLPDLALDALLDDGS